MEFAYSYIKNICVFTLVVTLILNIFPDMRYKKYIKLFAGLLLIALIFNPIIQFKKDRIHIKDILDKYSIGSYEVDLDDAVMDLETKMYERIENGYKKDSE